jgi:uncharacterized repeat protein (TIGR03803 family)
MRRILTQNAVIFPSVFTLAALTAQAQVFTVLKSFPSITSLNYTNSDGAEPLAGLVLSGSTLYGTASTGGDGGGIYGSGTVFKINTDGTGFTVLKSFPGAPAGSNHDGTIPQADLLIDGNTIYGSTSNGGSNELGTIFRINADGSDFTVLKQGILNEGAGYFSGLILDSNVLYGVSFSGGIFTNGSVFRISTNGSDYSVIKSFSAAATNESGIFTNAEGINPECTMIFDNGVLYGTTVSGGLGGRGTVFKVNTNGDNYTVLKTFPSLSVAQPRTNSEGASPLAGLVLSGNILYGTTWLGGTSGLGTVFKLNTDGGNFTVLKHFSALDGAGPFAGLVLNGSTLYGTTRSGGSATNGVIFKLHTDGNGYAVIKNFPPSIGSTNADGKNPQAKLVFAGSTLYGTARFGGTSAVGTIFKLDLRSTLDWQTVGSQLVFSWTNTDFSLQSSPNVSGEFSNILGASSPYTNSTTAPHQFFRLNGN